MNLSYGRFKHVNVYIHAPGFTVLFMGTLSRACLTRQFILLAFLEALKNTIHKLLEPDVYVFYHGIILSECFRHYIKVKVVPVL